MVPSWISRTVSFISHKLFFKLQAKEVLKLKNDTIKKQAMMSLLIIIKFGETDTQYLARSIRVKWWNKFDISLDRKEKIDEWVKMSQQKV